jgi:hypothetical protein
MENSLKCDYVWNNFKDVVVSFKSKYDQEDDDYIPLVLTRQKLNVPSTSTLGTS